MKKRVTAAILAAGMILSLAGCGSGSKEAATAAPEDTVQSTAAAGKEKETRIVVDHTGREVELPAEIDRVVISSILPLPSVYCLFEG